MELVELITAALENARTHRPSRALSLTITKLEEAALWACVWSTDQESVQTLIDGTATISEIQLANVRDESMAPDHPGGEG